MRMLVLALMVLAASGCVIRSAPPISPTACAVDPALVGTWTDRRMTQLGPAWIRLTLRADCTLSMRAQLLWMRFTETTRYRAEDGVLLFQQDRGVTKWPYRLDGGVLYLREAVNETDTYRRR